MVYCLTSDKPRTFLQGIRNSCLLCLDLSATSEVFVFVNVCVGLFTVDHPPLICPSKSQLWVLSSLAPARPTRLLIPTCERICLRRNIEFSLTDFICWQSRSFLSTDVSVAIPRHSNTLVCMHFVLSTPRLLRPKTTSHERPPLSKCRLHYARMHYNLGKTMRLKSTSRFYVMLVWLCLCFHVSYVVSSRFLPLKLGEDLHSWQQQQKCTTSIYWVCVNYIK